VTIALLGAIESLLSAIVADGMIGARHRSNTELIAQGFGNIGSALFGGMPATGAIARTVTNIKNGGRTPVAGIVHAITVLLIMLFLGKLIKYVPLACLPAYSWSSIPYVRMAFVLPVLTWSRGGAMVLLASFGLTVFVDLNVAIAVGVVLSRSFHENAWRIVTNIKIDGRNRRRREG
jgi:SulP family sulfate permease